MGRRLLKKQGRLGMSFMDLHNANDEDDVGMGSFQSKFKSKSSTSLLDLASNPEVHEKRDKKTYDSACAAAGQVCDTI